MFMWGTILLTICFETTAVKITQRSLNEWLALLKSCLRLSPDRDEGMKQSKHKVCCAEQKVRKNSFVMIGTRGPLAVFYLTHFPFIQQTCPEVHE